jgi:hypothetical protein
MKLLWILVLCLPTFGQTPSPIPSSQLTETEQALERMMGLPPVPDPVATAVAVGVVTPNVPATASISTPSSISPSIPLPQNFAGAGAAYNPIGSPKTTGWASWGRLIDAKSESYVFTTEDAILVRTGSTFSVQTSLRVGLATKLKQFGPLKVFGIMDGGGATTGLTTGGAASGGGIAEVQIKQSHYHIAVGFRIIKTNVSGGTPKMYEIGFFRDW